VRRPGPGVVANLEVSLLGRDIEDSPQRLTSRNQDITMGEPTYGPDSTFTDPTVGDLETSKLQDRTQWETSRQSQITLKASEAGTSSGGIGLCQRNRAGDNLDQSDINSLDLTGRGHVKLSLEPGGNYDSPEIRTFAKVKVSRAPVLTDVSEKGDDVRPASSPGLPNLPGKRLEDANISTFSPRSQGGTTSTVSNASNLRNALAELDDEDGELPLGQATPLQLEGVEAEPLEELGKVGSQLRPSSPAGNCSLGGQSNLIIDEVQQSLSSEDRTLEDSLRETSGIEGQGQLAFNKSNIVNITNTNNSVVGNKSVNFSRTTEIQVPATPTPQLKPGGSKFRTEEGATKVNDGKTSMIQVKQFAKSQALEVSLPPYEVMMAENNHTPGARIECANPMDKEECLKLTKLVLQDLHISQLDGQGEEQASSAVGEENGEDVDPHIWLNASKAPTPGQEWTSPTASEWELSRDALNVSILPMDLLSEEISLTEKSCWETSSLESLAKSCLDFSFTTGLQQVATVEPRLTEPCDIAYMPKRNHLLVTESKGEGRIGIFSGENLAFKGWCRYPKIYGEDGEAKRTAFFFPTNILCTKSGFVFIMEKDRILIFNEDLKLVQPPLKGHYSGLTEEEDGSVGTLQKLSDGVFKLKRIEFTDSPKELRLYGKASYWWTHKDLDLTINLPKEFSRSHSASKCWFLAAAGPDIHITDYGLGKVYTVNRDGSAQTAFGYLGSREGQLLKPAGILLDDRGNVMVSDSKNCRLQVFSAAGDFVKVAASLPSKPFGLIRQDCGEAGQFVVVTCVPCKTTGKKALLVKFRVLPA